MFWILGMSLNDNLRHPISPPIAHILFKTVEKIILHIIQNRLQKNISKKLYTE